MSAPAFTPTEWEILAHRLAVSDAIADALTDDGAQWSWMEIATRVDDLLGIDKDNIDLDDLSELDRAILHDCCTGSTFFADVVEAIASGQITQGWANARLKAAYSLDKKLKCPVHLS